MAMSAYVITSHYDAQTRDLADRSLARQIAQNRLTQMKSSVLSGNDFPPNTDLNDPNSYHLECPADPCPPSTTPPTPPGLTNGLNPALGRLAYPGAANPALMKIRVVADPVIGDDGRQVIITVIYEGYNGVTRQETITDFIYVA
jgi:hypothetical protein